MIRIIKMIIEMREDMFRLWCKLFKDNRMQADTVVCNEDITKSRTQKIFTGIETACYEFDLGKPIWLESNVEEFKKHSKVRFLQDNFIDNIDFDYMEIQVIEED